MASAAQIAANRRNALKSTGPKTKAGKRRSSLNALKHGLTSRTFTHGQFIDQRLVNMQLDALRERHQPQTEQEDAVLAAFAHRKVLAKQLRRLCFCLIERGGHPTQGFTAFLSTTAIDRLSRYEAKVNREMLQIMQDNREVFARDNLRRRNEPTIEKLLAAIKGALAQRDSNGEFCPPDNEAKSKKFRHNGPNLV